MAYHTTNILTKTFSISQVICEGSHRSPGISFTQGQLGGALMVFFLFVSLNKIWQALRLIWRLSYDFAWSLPAVGIPKKPEIHGRILSILAIDALGLKHQTIEIHSADWVIIALDQFHKKISYKQSKKSEDIITFSKRKGSSCHSNTYSFIVTAVGTCLLLQHTLNNGRRRDSRTALYVTNVIIYEFWNTGSVSGLC